MSSKFCTTLTRTKVSIIRMRTTATTSHRSLMLLLLLPILLVFLLADNRLNGLKIVAALKVSAQTSRIINRSKNDAFIFNCMAKGNPKPSIQYYRGDQKLRTNST